MFCLHAVLLSPSQFYFTRFLSELRIKFWCKARFRFDLDWIFCNSVIFLQDYENKTLFASFCKLALHVLNVLFTCSACISTYMISAIFSALAKNHAFNHFYGVYKKKVIELQRAIVSELLCVWTRFFHIRKDHAFSCWMISSSCQMDKKLANTNPIKNVSQNRIFSPLRVGSKTIENEPPFSGTVKLMNFTSLNYAAHIHNYY
jgi:hypothetical protein